MTDRREQIADAGITLLATRGIRALTHRAIDEELGLPAGSTSYYARTKRDLVNLIVQRLAGSAGNDATAHELPEAPTPEVVAQLMVSALDTLMHRENDHRARLLLHMECRNDPILSEALAARPAIRETFTQMAAELFRRLNVSDPETNARDAVGLLDGMLMQRIIRGAHPDEQAIFEAYLRGLPTNVQTGSEEKSTSISR